MQLLETAPLWLIWALLAVALGVAEEAGLRLQALGSRRWGASKGGEGVGYLVSAALALLGLLIAFTFSMAAGRYDQRRNLVNEEANAIATTYLRYQLLHEPFRGELSGLMAEYVEARKQISDAGNDRVRLQAASDRTDALQDRIWAALARAVREPPGAAITTPLQQTTNQMFDLAASRRTAYESRVPVTILRCLLLYALVCALFMGYGLTGGRRHYVVSVALFVLLSMAITLIVDLDRPRSGTVRVDQAPLLRAVAMVERHEAAKARGGAAPVAP